MRDVYTQFDSGLRFDWGLTGAGSLVEQNENICLVVIDVLSFTTTVSVALSRGMSVLPYCWNDATAVEFARENKASLAVGRSEMNSENPWSLSPAALLKAPFTERLVLPSPNGSTIAAAGKGTVAAASLRNAGAVARYLVEAGFGTKDRPAVVIAAGEKWTSDDSLRPCLEDLLGAGAVLSKMIDLGCNPSVEALIAANAYASVSSKENPMLEDIVRGCASGRELIADGYAGDVEAAVNIEADSVVPVIVDGTFKDVSKT